MHGRHVPNLKFLHARNNWTEFYCHRLPNIQSLYLKDIYNVMPMASCYAEVLREKMLTGLLIHCFLLINLSFGLNENQRGHLKPFGNHREPEIVTDELLFVPDPTQFWEQYVSKNRPVVFREAAKHSR